MNQFERAEKHFHLRDLAFFWGSVIMTIAVLMIALAAGLAFGQPVGAPVTPPPDPAALLKAIMDGVQVGNGWLIAGPALSLIVWALRKYDKAIPVIGLKIDLFLNQPMVAFLLPTVLAGLTGLFGALAMGTPVGAALLAALKVAGGAVFTFLLAKNAAEQIGAAKADGAAAAAAVTDGQAAVQQINKAG